MTYEPPITDYDYIVENCTCAFCGCNCDDLDYLVKDNHVVAVRHACRLGASKIMEDMDQRLLVPMIRDENGELMEVDWDTALDKAAEYIANSIRPSVCSFEKLPPTYKFSVSNFIISLSLLVLNDFPKDNIYIDSTIFVLP